jgi:putative endonuclease
MYYVYFLFSQQANKFYVGHSADPWKRLNQHLANSADKYTGGYHDWQLIAVFEVSELRGDADKIEKFIKRQKSRNLINKIIEHWGAKLDTSANCRQIKLTPIHN